MYVSCVHACVNACVHACVHACMHACVHACTRTRVHACMRSVSAHTSEGARRSTHLTTAHCPAHHTPTPSPKIALSHTHTRFGVL